MHIFPEELIEKVRRAIDPETLLRKINYRPETIQNIRGTIKSFCPIHREPIFRTLLIDAETRTYRCSNKQCAGHEGGDLIDLYARSRGVGYEEAIPQLAQIFGVEIDLDKAGQFVERALEVAENYAEMGAWEEARSQFERILGFQPDSIQALRGLIRVAEAGGQSDETAELKLRLASALTEAEQHEEAAALFADCLALRPDDKAARLLYIDCLERLGQTERLAGEYMNLADQLTGEGDVDRALEIYRRLEAMNIDAIDVSMHILEILTSTGRREEAIAELSRRIEEAIESGRFDAAVAGLRSALELDPARDDLRVRLARAVAEHLAEGPAFDETIRQIRIMIDNRAHGPAAQALDFLLEAFPRRVELLELKGDLEEARGHDEAAFELRMECADEYEQRGRHEQALEALGRVAGDREDDVQLLSRMAALHRELGRNDEAVEAYLRIIALFESAGEFDHAAAVYQTVIDLVPDELRHRERQFELYLRLGLEPIVVKKAFALAEAYRARDRHEQAAAALERAAGVVPENAELLGRHAEILEQLGRTSEAAEQFLSVARVYLGQQQFDRARHCLEKTLECLPEHMEARELRADVLARQDMTLQAMSEYGELAQACLNAGDPEPVVRIAEKILALQPDHLQTLQLLTAAWGALGNREKQRETQMRLVKLFRQTQSYTRASELCAQILEADEDYTPAIEQLVTIAEITHQSGNAVRHLWRLAQSEARRGRREEESELLNKILARDPLHRDAWQRNLELLGQWASPRVLADAVGQAIEEFTKAQRPGEILQILEGLKSAKTPKPEFLAGLVRLRRATGDDEGAREALREQAQLLIRALREDEAIEALGELAELDPEDLNVRRMRIDLMLRTDRREAAVGEFRRLAEVYVERRRLIEAAEMYNEILRIQPEDAVAREALLDLYIRLDEREKAGDAIENLAAHYVRVGEFDRAAGAWERALELDADAESVLRKIIAIKQRARDVPGALEYYHRLLDALAETGQGGDYEQTVHEAIALDPSNWRLRRRLIDHLKAVGRSGEAETALIELARLQLRSNQPDAAVATVEEALEMNPESVQGRACRAELLAKTGDTERALKEFLSLSGNLTSARALARGDEPNAPFAFGNYEGLTRVREYTFENFVVGARNNFAHATATAVARAPGRNYNPLFLYADVGLGKTHLCHAMANHILEHHPDLKVMYTMTEDFIVGLIDAIQNNTITPFRNRHRLTDVLIIDDIQFLSGKERAQEEFFHIFNALFEAGKQIVITSDRPPKDISHLEKRLRSRFGAGIIVDIQSPDLETRIAILRRELGHRGRAGDLTDEVVLYLAENIPANIRDLKGALNQLLAHCDVTQEAVDLALAQQTVEQLSAQA